LLFKYKVGNFHFLSNWMIVLTSRIIVATIKFPTNSLLLLKQRLS